MKKNPTELSWKIYRKAFKEGQRVFIEDSNGALHMGKLKTQDNGVTLVRTYGIDLFLWWDEIVFMCHDGFPVRKIMGMTPEEAVKRADETSTEIIRRKLLQIVTYDKAYEDGGYRKYANSIRYPSRSFGGGCPFVFEDVRIKEIYNVGNNHPRFWGEDDEETLVLQSKDGAIMHSFAMEHLFLFDGLKLEV